LPASSAALIAALRQLPGDIIVYFDDRYDASHSGTIIEPPSALHAWNPLVCGKWGKYREMLHRANDCPYGSDFIRARYYRVQQC